MGLCGMIILVEDGEQCPEERGPGDEGKGRGKSTEDRTKHSYDLAEEMPEAEHTAHRE